MRISNWFLVLAVLEFFVSAYTNRESTVTAVDLFFCFGLLCLIIERAVDKLGEQSKKEIK